MNYYLDPITKKYVDFEGRATRQEFWMFTLINLIVSVIVSVIAKGVDFQALYHVYNLVLLLPSLTIGVRRLHDTDRTGWWMLLCLIPIIGWLILIYFYALDTEPTDNQYGPNPKAGAPVTPTPAV